MRNSATERIRVELQRNLDDQKTSADRNKRGQFATPTMLAREILSYAKRVLPKSQKIRFLDPALGTGAFYSALLEVFGKKAVAAATGFEIDPHYGTDTQKLWSDFDLDFRLADFTKAAVPKMQGQRYNL